MLHVVSWPCALVQPGVFNERECAVSDQVQVQVQVVAPAVGPAEVFQWTSQRKTADPRTRVKVRKLKLSTNTEDTAGLVACATLNVTENMKRISAAAPECTHGSEWCAGSAARAAAAACCPELVELWRLHVSQRSTSPRHVGELSL